MKGGAGGCMDPGSLVKFLGPQVESYDGGTETELPLVSPPLPPPDLAGPATGRGGYIVDDSLRGLRSLLLRSVQCARSVPNLPSAPTRHPSSGVRGLTATLLRTGPIPETTEGNSLFCWDNGLSGSVSHGPV